MRTILESFDKKTPYYPSQYREIILERFSRKGGGTEDEKFSQGKYFANFYECFIYAALLGIRKEYKLPFDRAKEGTKFIEIEYWKPRPLALYIFMILLESSNLDLLEIEDFAEDQIESQALKLVNELEQYANGGFDLIKARLDEDKSFFEGPFGALNFLREEN